MADRKIKEEWACSIISQALMEIKSKKDIPRVIEKVRGTAVGVRPDLMKEFERLARMKGKMSHIK